MAQHWEDREKLKDRVSLEGRVGHVFWLLGVAFAVLGVIGDAADITLGLEPTTWLLLAVAAFVAGIISFIEWAVAWYLKTTDREKEE